MADLLTALALSAALDFSADVTLRNDRIGLRAAATQLYGGPMGAEIAVILLAPPGTYRPFLSLGRAWWDGPLNGPQASDNTYSLGLGIEYSCFRAELRHYSTGKFVTGEQQEHTNTGENRLFIGTFATF